MKRLLQILRRHRGALLPMAVLLASRTAIAQQQEEGPVYGLHQKPPMFRIVPIHGAVTLESQYASNSTSVKGGGKVDGSILSFRELLDLATSGYVVHPNLMEFNLAGTIGLEQDMISGTAGNADSDSAIYQWDANATFLRNQDLTAVLYTHRTQTLINQPFGETFQSTDTIYGAELQYKSKFMPTTVRAYRTETVQSSLTGQQSFSLNQDALEWHTDLNFSQYNTLSWYYNFISTDQTSGLPSQGNQFSSSSETQTESLSHNFAFGNDHANTLTSTAVMTSTTGVSPRDSLRWDEVLRLRHTQNFQTEYSYSFDQETTPDVDQQVQIAQASFQHRLYSSLVTRGLFRYSEMDLSEESSSQTELARFDVDYRKKVPYGLLLANLGLLYSQQEDQARINELPVLNQPITFNGFSPVIIQRPDIVPGSIDLHNLAGFHYSPISDYRAFYLPTYAQLERVPTSLYIHDGQPLLMDYLLEPEPATSTTTEAFNIGARYDIQQGPLTGLSPYVDYYMQQQDFTAAGPTALRADQVQDVRIGADYYRGDWVLKAEYQMHDSTVYPFDATRFKARWNHRFGTDTIMAAEGNYTITNYSNPTNQNTILSATGSISRELARNLILTASVDWLSVEDQIGGKTQGLQEQLDLNWRYRQLEFFMRLRNSSLDTTFQNETFQFFMIGIKREF